MTQFRTTRGRGPKRVYPIDRIRTRSEIESLLKDVKQRIPRTWSIQPIFPVGSPKLIEGLIDRLQSSLGTRQIGRRSFKLGQSDRAFVDNLVMQTYGSGNLYGNERIGEGTGFVGFTSATTGMVAIEEELTLALGAMKAKFVEPNDYQSRAIRNIFAGLSDEEKEQLRPRGPKSGSLGSVSEKIYYGLVDISEPRKPVTQATPTDLVVVTRGLIEESMKAHRRKQVAKNVASLRKKRESSQ